ncbi:MAG: 2-C-methyl-D-erythritol 4-phosphate cytidylyltransferase [Cellvibrionaceae bacterium]
MGSDKPKQYLTIGNKTVLEHTLNRLLSLPAIDSVHVAISKNDTCFDSLDLPKGVCRVEGGAERYDSVLNGLKAIAPHVKADDWVLVHDAARCCVMPENIQRLIDELKLDPVGGLLALPASDTLKEVDEDGRVSCTIDRSIIWQAQTPQLFRYSVLLHALEASVVKGFPITDEASAMEQAGYRPKLIPGRRDNIKITTPEDLALAEFIYQQSSRGISD